MENVSVGVNNDLGEKDNPSCNCKIKLKDWSPALYRGNNINSFTLLNCE